ncbi:MAG: YtcA family lipoprotein [Janthinobacterium lividum]
MTSRPMPAIRLVMRCAALSFFVLMLGGCTRSPSFNVLGSYFPGWIACMIAGVLVTVVIRLILNRTGLEQKLPSLPLFYFATTMLVACILWLIAFE